ncbi:ImmA/IrrE family metallo-endopeptidase [Stomatohabitans albus]|uniref:ImmA/IrrE family metallo-endopeptidase n=1 Tax=Stomatohabitans albus TaxID=3110766 RepID=UPI00300D0C31
MAITRLPYVVTPGDVIKEWIDEEGINAAELSRRLGVSRKHVSELLRGKTPLTHQMAISLEHVTGVPARIWNQHEAGYRADLAHIEAREALLPQWEIAKLFPIKYLQSLGIISSPNSDKPGIIQELLSFLQIATLDAFNPSWADSSIAYRRVAVQHNQSYALATWLMIAEHHAKTIEDLPPYTKAGLEAHIPLLRSLTSKMPEEGIPEAIATLESVGVVLCLVPPIPGFGTYGATHWVNNTPVIQLSLRGKKDDQCWFTLFHEIGHVLLHGDNDLYLLDDESMVEEEANAFAASTLVPELYQARLPENRDIEAIKTLATELDIAPSLVLGQAQRKTRDFSWGHKLKRPVNLETRLVDNRLVITPTT